MPDNDETRLVLVPAGMTCWEKDQRLVGNTDLPVCPESEESIRLCGEQLKTVGVNILYSGISGPAEETARRLAGALRVRHRKEKDLGEVNLGFWQGLPLSAIRQRHPKAFRQWQEDPDSVTPPEGERLDAAHDRLEHCLAGILKKHPGQKVGVVLGPMALAVARSAREGKTVHDFWALMKEPLTWHEYLIRNTVGAMDANG